MSKSAESVDLQSQSRSDNYNYRKSSNSLLLDTMIHVTTVVHTLVFAFLVLILYLCFANEWSLFAWHPFLLTIGVSQKIIEQNLLFVVMNLL